jgi:hypothetical protein
MIIFASVVDAYKGRVTHRKFVIRRNPFEYENEIRVLTCLPDGCRGPRVFRKEYKKREIILLPKDR